MDVGASKIAFIAYIALFLRFRKMASFPCTHVQQRETVGAKINKHKAIFH